MSLKDGLTALAQAIGIDIKGLRRQAGYNAGGVISQAWYDNSSYGMTNGTSALAAGVIQAVPYMSPVDMPIDRLALVVTTLAAAGSADMHIYECLDNGWPGNKLYSSAAVATTSTGKKEVTLSFTFEAGKTYWLGVRANVAVTLRAIQLTGAKAFGMLATDGSGSSYATSLIQNSNMSGAAPSAWGTVTAAQWSANASPSIRFRAV